MNNNKVDVLKLFISEPIAFTIIYVYSLHNLTLSIIYIDMLGIHALTVRQKCLCGLVWYGGKRSYRDIYATTTELLAA